MADVVISVEGAAELRKAFRQAGNGLPEALRTANEYAAEVVVDSAMPFVPRRSGRLRGSVRAMASQASGRAVAGDKGVPYAAAIHWGRKRGNVGSPPGNRKGRNPIKGRPFLWDAAQREVPRIEPEYRQEIMRLIEAAMRGR